MNPVVHFEIPYEDRDRMADFYGRAFGWKAQKMGKDMGNYMVLTTTELDEKTQRPKQPGAINGGAYQKTDDPSSHSPGFVIAVEDMDDAIKKVKDAGGTVVGGSKGDGKPEEIPGVGLWCSFLDSEGNRLSMLVPKPM